MQEMMTVQSTEGSRQNKKGDFYYPVKAGGLTYYLDQPIKPGQTITVEVRESSYTSRNGKTAVSRWATVIGQEPPGLREMVGAVLTQPQPPPAMPGIAESTNQIPPTTQAVRTPGIPTLGQILDAIGMIADSLPASWAKESPQGCRAYAQIINTCLMGIGRGEIKLEAPEREPGQDDDDAPPWSRE